MNQTFQTLTYAAFAGALVGLAIWLVRRVFYGDATEIDQSQPWYSAKTLFSLRIVTTFGFVGHLRPAPGTWASALALGLGMVIDRYLGTPVLLAATLGVTALGFWACSAALTDRPGEDPSEIVIDEVAGMWIALLFPAFAFWARGFEGWLPWPAWVVPFLFFRLFDIWKPWVIGRADRRGDPAGVMLDDLWAGLFAGIATVIAAVAWHLPVML